MESNPPFFALIRRFFGRKGPMLFGKWWVGLRTDSKGHGKKQCANQPQTPGERPTHRRFRPTRHTIPAFDLARSATGHFPRRFAASSDAKGLEAARKMVGWTPYWLERTRKETSRQPAPNAWVPTHPPYDPGPARPTIPNRPAIESRLRPYLKKFNRACKFVRGCGGHPGMNRSTGIMLPSPSLTSGLP